MQRFMLELEKSEEIDSDRDRAYSHVNIATVNIYQENFDKASIHLEQAEELAKR